MARIIKERLLRPFNRYCRYLLIRYQIKQIQFFVIFSQISLGFLHKPFNLVIECIFLHHFFKLSIKSLIISNDSFPSYSIDESIFELIPLFSSNLISL